MNLPPSSEILNQPLLSRNCIYKTLFGTALAQVHKRRDSPGRDSNPHSDTLTTPELGSDTLDHSLILFP